MQKLFLLQPGEVKSISDWQVHYVGVGQLCQLYEVRPEECIVEDPAHPERMLGFDPEYLQCLMVLGPLTNGLLYRPVNEFEREQVKERLREYEARCTASV